MTSFYLTIDDGPSDNMAAKLQFLGHKNIKAVWFCLGKSLELRRAIAIEAIQEGHVIGNHSYNHSFFSNIPLDECRREIVSTERIIDHIYNQSGMPRPAKLFRFPYGEQGDFDHEKPSQKPEKVLHKARLRELLKELGFRSWHFSEVEYLDRIYRNQPDDVDWMWSYDIHEWAINYTQPRTGFPLTFDQVKDNLKNYLKSYNHDKRQIVLMHDSERTSEYFSQLIEIFIATGIKFTLPEF